MHSHTFASIFRRAAIILAAAASLSAADTTISLAGAWRLKLDPDRVGIKERWHDQRLPDKNSSFLPGSLDQAGYGTKTSGPEKGWLSRPYAYTGPAWYERDVVIPESWRGRRITLFLERAHWQTSVWVDGAPFGSEESLAVPHVYDLSRALAPGRHRITLCVDNTYSIEVGINAHSVTEHTQTNWNGVVGRIELRATDAVWIDSAALYPDIAARKLRIEATVGNSTGQTVAGELKASIAGAKAAAAPVRFSASGREQKVEIVLALGRDIRLWDEFDAALYTLDLSLVARAGSAAWTDSRREQFGMREIGTRNKQFLLNGRPTFLRGTLECNIFPLTGYPPTDGESWERLFHIARSYGLNHFRFHSACPPEAAFAAADRTGFMLQIELPVWTKIKQNPRTMEFMRSEGRRILKAYGNHPSFTMLGLGNEFTDDFDFLHKLLGEFKAGDPRRLYTFSADHTGRGPGATSDYYVGQKTKAGGPMRIHGSRFEKTPPSTDFDFTKHISETTIPTVAHELGQWAVFPDYSEIARYTGVLKPRNLEAFRDALAERGMIDQAGDFQRASGAFAWLLYKEEIETALRTPNYGGVQLLQLQDFPGQGEALVGLLDSFWQSKGILTPEQFRQFSSETAPLLRVGKFTWTSDETFTATAEVAHYGKADLAAAKAVWKIMDESGRQVATGRFAPATVKVGSVTRLGEIRVPLGVRTAAHLRVAIEVQGTAAHNEWGIWVYPKALDTSVPSDITIAHAYDADARKALAEGRKVLLLWPAGPDTASTLKTQFLPVFWSLSWFKAQPGTMGILCDPKHPALASFPTAMHSDYQWWDITQPSRAFILDGAPAGFRPIVQVIDDFHRNHKLGAIFETRVGEGKLLISSLDLESDLDRRPAARQLRHSLLAYMQSEGFKPAAALSAETLEALLK